MLSLGSVLDFGRGGGRVRFKDRVWVRVRFRLNFCQYNGGDGWLSFPKKPMEISVDDLRFSLFYFT